MFNASALTASITVADLAKSMAWYRDAIGFEVTQEHQREGKLAAVSLQAGDVRILLNQDNGARGWDRVKGEGISIQFTVRGDIDDVASHIKSSGWTLDSEPADMPWGVRMFRLKDPDGFKLVFSTERK
jgi:uncharacterized glyoxalase superfamily protein PhnB